MEYNSEEKKEMQQQTIKEEEKKTEEGNEIVPGFNNSWIADEEDAEHYSDNGIIYNSKKLLGSEKDEPLQQDLAAMVDRIAVDDEEGEEKKINEVDTKYKESELPEHHCISTSILILLRQILLGSR